VTFSFDKGVAKIIVIPQTNGKNAVSLRFGGVPLTHGSGYCSRVGCWGGGCRMHPQASAKRACV
jgi:hypothetical protein